MSETPVLAPKTIEQMRRLDITEADVLAVWRGQPRRLERGIDFAVRRYADRGELGVLFSRRGSGETVIIAVWRRNRF